MRLTDLLFFLFFPLLVVVAYLGAIVLEVSGCE